MFVNDVEEKLIHGNCVQLERLNVDNVKRKDLCINVSDWEDS